METFSKWFTLLSSIPCIRGMRALKFLKRAHRFSSSYNEGSFKISKSFSGIDSNFNWY